MTRKNYVAFAAMLADIHVKNDPVATRTFDNIVEGMVDVFTEDNPRFDADRFRAAAGVE